MLVPTERQLALFRAVEDIHDLTQAITVLLVDADGTSIAVSGDEDEIPRSLRAVIGGKKLRVAGSVRELLSSAGELPKTRVNLSVFDVDGEHVLAILFDADADLMTVETVGREAKEMIAEILSA